MAALLASSRQVMADDESAPNNPFILLLHGIYQPVPIGEGPSDNLGLTTVNLNVVSTLKRRSTPFLA